MNKLGLASRAGRLLAFGLVSLGALCAAPAFAVDLGVQGTVYPIIEVDIRQVLMQQLASKDTGKIEEQMTESAKGYMDRLPKHAAPGVNSTQTVYYDPSFTLQNDIWAPGKNEKGDYAWQLLYPKGTRVNPLEKQRPYNAMLFFDGTSKEQVAFVAAALARYPGKMLPIEATGANPAKLSDQLKTPVYTVTQAMSSKFDTAHTPSLLYPGEKEHSLELGFTTFGPPFSVEELGKTWPSGFNPSLGVRP